MVPVEQGKKVRAEVLTGKVNSPEVDFGGRKRAAIELIRNHDSALRNSARRYSICRDDSEDAYQRGIEILLSKAPTTDLRQLLPWARTVIKHEALAIRKSRERTLGRPGGVSEDDSENWIDLIPSSSDGPDERAIRREKIDRSREALAKLKPHELKALTMLAEGYSYAEIGAHNQWTRTKVNRCLAEGRHRFRSVFHESEAGQRCEKFEPIISACCDGEAEPSQQVELENHLAACGHCRATLRTFRATPQAAAALLPAAPLSHSIWDRFQELAVSAQMRFQGLGSGSDSSVSAIAASGGTRGMGAAALAKLATICVGTAGGAAACMAAGVLPVPALVDGNPSKTPVVRTADGPANSQPVSVEPAHEPQGPSAVTDAGSPTASPTQSKPSTQPQESATPPAPVATATQAEFTPEAAGTPVPAAAASAPPAKQSGPPLGSGGGEFGP